MSSLAPSAPEVNSSVQLSSVAQSYLILCDPTDCSSQASLSITNSWSLLKLMSIELVMPSSHPSSVVPFSSCPQSFPASGSFQMSQFFTSGGQSIGHSFLPMNIEHHSSKASVLWHSAFFTGQLSHPYMTTGKTLDLTRQTFVDK